MPETATSTVSAFAIAYLAGLEAAGVAGVAKHFPGHGDTALDSHLELPSINADRARLDSVELPPFRDMIAAGVPGIMTAHVTFAALEPGVPATLSGAALTDLLRGELGFEGVVVTDFMDMKAIADNYGAGEAAVRSVVAGADLVMISSELDTQREVYAALQAAVRDGRLSQERVLEAVARTENLATHYPPAWDAVPPDYAAHQMLANDIASVSITLLWNDGALPLPTGRTVVIAPQPPNYGDTFHLGSILKRYHANVNSIIVSPKPSPTDIETAVAAAQGAERIVLGSYHWLGDFPPTLNDLHSELVATGVPVVSVALGNPDDLRFLDAESAAYLAVYGFREANLIAAAQLLTGQQRPLGRLSVPAGDYEVGSGLADF